MHRGHHADQINWYLYSCIYTFDRTWDWNNSRCWTWFEPQNVFERNVEPSSVYSCLLIWLKRMFTKYNIHIKVAAGHAALEGKKNIILQLKLFMVAHHLVPKLRLLCEPNPYCPYCVCWAHDQHINNRTTFHRKQIFYFTEQVAGRVQMLPWQYQWPISTECQFLRFQIFPSTDVNALTKVNSQQQSTAQTTPSKGETSSTAPSTSEQQPPS